MSLLQRSLAVATHAFWFREGDAFALPAPGVCAVDAKPDPDDNGWLDVGAIEKADDKIVEESKVTLWKPTPGHLVRSQILTLKQGMDHSFTANEITPIALEAFYRTSQKLDSGSVQANSLSAVPRNGWLKLQRYDNEDVAFLVADVWCRLTVAGGMNFGGDAAVMPEFLAEELYSALNTIGF